MEAEAEIQLGAAEAEVEQQLRVHPLQARLEEKEETERHPL